MHVTYAVTWQESGGYQCSGRLELGVDALMLEGRNGGSPVSLAVRYSDVGAFRLAHGTPDRLNGRPTLILDLVSGGSLRIASVAQTGIVAELADRLSVLRHDQSRSERMALVVPLKEGARPRAKALLEQGPPFDPSAVGLEGHEVFLTDREAVFVFEGVPSVIIDRIASDVTVWRATGAWEPLVDGSIRFADRAYAWSSTP